MTQSYTRGRLQSSGGSPLVASLFAPATLPNQLDQVVAELRGTRAAVERLTGAIGAQGETPEDEVIIIPFSSASVPNAWYQTTDQLRIIALDFWSDTNGRWHLQLESDPSIAFRTNANVKQRVIDPPGRLVVPRGLRIGFTLDGQAAYGAGAAAWDAILFAHAGTAQGRQNAG